MVAVDFSPRFADTEEFRRGATVETFTLGSRLHASLRDALSLLILSSGLKSTATIITSLREGHDRAHKESCSKCVIRTNSIAMNAEKNQQRSSFETLRSSRLCVEIAARMYLDHPIIHWGRKREQGK